jgi:predicted DsbA family dithiol-disulfide isomerase
MAQRLGIRGVPFFVIDQKLGVSGAQSPEVLRQAFAQARR